MSRTSPYRSAAGSRKFFNDMTTTPILLMTSAYFVALVVVAYLTRATSRRVLGAVSGGAVVGVISLAIIALCEALGWWRMPIASTPFHSLLLYFGIAISCSPIYLVTWRISRRFGWRGLAIFTGVITVIGAPRDYFIAAKFPQWMVFSPGVAPILADSIAYFLIVVAGHAVMRLVAGPSTVDPLARAIVPVVA
jgi:hypothetical protein